MMENPKFTPGPWGFDEFSIFGINGGDVVTTCPGMVYDEYDGDPDTLDVSPENVALILAAPDLYAAGEAQTDIIRRAQAILTQYLIPDGIDGPEAINQLLGLLDGPDQRAAQSLWDGACAKVRGET